MAVRTTSDGDGCTVHVDLAIADAVVPRPRKSCDSIGEALGDGESEWMCARVTIGVDRAASLEDLDELEGRVRGRLLIERDCDLACPTTMRGRAIECELLRLPNSHLVHRGDVVHSWALLARVVRPRTTRSCINQRRVVERRDAKWHRRLHDQVRVAESGEGQGRRSDGRIVEGHLPAHCCTKLQRQFLPDAARNACALCLEPWIL